MKHSKICFRAPYRMVTDDPSMPPLWARKATRRLLRGMLGVLHNLERYRTTTERGRHLGRRGDCKMITWLSPCDCVPPHRLNLSPGSRDRLKVEDLLTAFCLAGFDVRYPALVGYPLDGKIQLLSGTHRHCAASLAEIDLPVTLWLRSDIERAWGRPQWLEVMADIPVMELDSDTPHTSTR